MTKAEQNIQYVEFILRAFDLLDPYCRPTWYVDEFRNHLVPCRSLGRHCKVSNKISA
jgi:hypothetical protein